MAEASSRAPVALADLPKLRAGTEAIGKVLRSDLEQQLETLQVLFAPRRILGRFSGGSAGRDDVAGAERTVAALEAAYREIAGKPPFVLRPQLDREALKQIDRLELYPWEYPYEIRSSDGEARVVDITSPVRWVLNYASGYTLSQLRKAVTGKEEKRSDDMRQFVLSSLVLKALLEQYPALTRLLAHLRYDVAFEKAPGLGALSLVTLQSHLDSVRPHDDVILGATAISGVNAFIEIVDRQSLASLRDPLREKIERALG
jgi:hypothetical protein